MLICIRAYDPEDGKDGEGTEGETEGYVEEEGEGEGEEGSRSSTKRRVTQREEK